MNYESMTRTQLLNVYNDAAIRLGHKQLKGFKDHPTAVSRTRALLEDGHVTASFDTVDATDENQESDGPMYSNLVASEPKVPKVKRGPYEPLYTESNPPKNAEEKMKKYRFATVSDLIASLNANRCRVYAKANGTPEELAYWTAKFREAEARKVKE